MDKDTITLWAEAKRAGIADYRKMQPAELRKAIASAKTAGSTPAKGKAAATNGNGSKGKATAAAVVKGTAAGTKGKATATPAKGKATTSVKRAPAAKSTAQKSTPAKGKATAAQGKATRPATGGTAKATASKATPAKATAAKTAAAKPAARGKAAESYVVKIDNKAVNWKAPWSGGTTGKRGTVMDALREHKGDKDKVFAQVKRYAVKWYPTKDKHAADRMVRWLIGRVALDFAKATGQHQSGVRAAYGTSTKPNDVRRREARATAAAPARTRRAPAVSKAKATPAKAPARKPAAARTAPAKGKPAASRTPAKGKAAPAKGKGR